MKRFTTGFLVASLTFIFGISAFTWWLILRHAKHSAAIQSKISDTKPQLLRTHLIPLLQKHNLIASEPDNNHEVPDIEEADARLFSPLTGETIFLQTQSPTADSEELKPRYWLYISAQRGQQNGSIVGALSLPAWATFRGSWAAFRASWAVTIFSSSFYLLIIFAFLA